MSDLISVVTGFYNRGSFVESSITSLLNQSYQNIEIIVFDDCSTDNTYDELSKIKDDRLKLIRHKINIGFVSGLINAVNQASGQYIAIHGSGDISYPERLGKQYKVLASRDEIGAVGCNVLNFDQAPNGTIIKSIKKCRAHEILKEDLVDGGNCFTHGEVMMKRKYYDMVGGYRKAFYFSQDRDLWLRLIDVCQFGSVDEVLYERIYIPNSLRFNLGKVLIQKKYSELARQCAEMKANGEKDLVDLYGLQALGFLKKSKRLSSFYYQLFSDHILENPELSAKCLNMSVDECLTTSNSISLFFVRMLGIYRFSQIWLICSSLSKFSSKAVYKTKAFLKLLIPKFSKSV